jgi:aryl-alcohol dehydrogenase-like predicted oxidoreductase
MRRSFGDDVHVSILGIGGGRIGSLNNPVPIREIERMLAAAVDAGINLFDTADIYGQGDSERTLGRLAARHPGRVFVITKIGFVHRRHAGLIRVAKPLLRLWLNARSDLRQGVVQARARLMEQDFSIAHLRRAADASRRRLGIDRLDGLLLHDPPLTVLRDPRTADVLHELACDGIASNIGVSACAVDEVEAALAIPAVTMLQVPMIVAAELERCGIADRLRNRRIALFVREVLPKAGDDRHGPDAVRTAVAGAIVPDFVTAAIVGVSTRHHLDELLDALP